MTYRTTPNYDVVVIGGGVIGLSVAWRAAGRGCSVAVADPEPGRGASYAAAGMLAAVTELHHGEEQLLRLNLASAERYPAFVSELEDASGLEIGYRTCGTLALALDADDKAVLDDLHALQNSLGLSACALSGRECRKLEPMLAPRVRGGLLIAGDHQIDNRALIAALLTAGQAAGVALYRQRVSEVVVSPRDRVTGARLVDGTELAARNVVVAAGCWSASVAGLPPDAVPPVRPVKGQILRLRISESHAPFLSRTIRALVKGTSVYLVPRLSGELVIGATVEEFGYGTQVTAGGVYELLRDAHEIVPGISELPLVETHAGLRPGSPDNAPLLGPTGLDGLIMATGHYRNGILLTPVTADTVAELLVTGTIPAVAAPFTPRRFERRPEGQEVLT
jgi:glycine oxidase